VRGPFAQLAELIRVEKTPIHRPLVLSQVRILAVPSAPGHDRIFPSALPAAALVSYSGRFEVDEASKVVEHHVELSSYPNFIGKTQVRVYELSEEDLTLRVPSINIGNEIAGGYLPWRRL
jgi:hypothetical protein